jgi:hypothetical protein
MAKTQKNKATSFHLGNLAARTPSIATRAHTIQVNSRQSLRSLRENSLPPRRVAAVVVLDSMLPVLVSLVWGSLAFPPWARVHL